MIAEKTIDIHSSHFFAFFAFFSMNSTDFYSLQTSKFLKVKDIKSISLCSHTLFTSWIQRLMMICFVKGNVQVIKPFVKKQIITSSYPEIFPNVTTLIIAENINGDIKLPKKVTSLIFWYRFNQFIVLPETLLHLQMGGLFNQPVTIPPTLKSLTIGWEFNQPIFLPESLVYFTYDTRVYKNTKPGMFNNQCNLHLSLMELTN